MAASAGVSNGPFAPNRGTIREHSGGPTYTSTRGTRNSSPYTLLTWCAKVRVSSRISRHSRVMIIGDTRAGSLPGIEISFLPGAENFAERTEISARTVGVQRPPAASAAAAAVDDRGVYSSMY